MFRRRFDLNDWIGNPTRNVPADKLLYYRLVMFCRYAAFVRQPSTLNEVIWIFWLLQPLLEAVPHPVVFGGGPGSIKNEHCPSLAILERVTLLAVHHN